MDDLSSEEEDSVLSLKDQLRPRQYMKRYPDIPKKGTTHLNTFAKLFLADVHDFISNVEFYNINRT